MKIVIGLLLVAIGGGAALLSLRSSVQPTPHRMSASGDVLDAVTAENPAQTASVSAPPVSVESVAVTGSSADAATVHEEKAWDDASTSTSSTTTPVNLGELPPSAVRDLLIPVVGVKAGALTDTFTEARGSGRVHDAIDIMAAHGTPVVAANDGHVVKLFTSKPGGLTVYEFDPDNRVIYYYAHLDGYAPGLAEGQTLRRGDPVGFVGSTGNARADAPHLHFEVQILGPEKQWWHATSINPYGRFEGQQPASAVSVVIP